MFWQVSTLSSILVKCAIHCECLWKLVMKTFIFCLQKLPLTSFLSWREDKQRQQLVWVWDVIFSHWANCTIRQLCLKLILSLAPLLTHFPYTDATVWLSHWFILPQVTKSSQTVYCDDLKRQHKKLFFTCHYNTNGSKQPLISYYRTWLWSIQSLLCSLYSAQTQYTT